MLAAVSAYVYRDEALPSTGGFPADLGHVKDNYFEGTCFGSFSVYACVLAKLCVELATH